jgi:hypothetical protein
MSHLAGAFAHIAALGTKAARGSSRSSRTYGRPVVARRPSRLLVAPDLRPLTRIFEPSDLTWRAPAVLLRLEPGDEEFDVERRMAGVSPLRLRPPDTYTVTRRNGGEESFLDNRFKTTLEGWDRTVPWGMKAARVGPPRLNLYDGTMTSPSPLPRRQWTPNEPMGAPPDPNDAKWRVPLRLYRDQRQWQQEQQLHLQDPRRFAAPYQSNPRLLGPQERQRREMQENQWRIEELRRQQEQRQRQLEMDDRRWLRQHPTRLLAMKAARPVDPVDAALARAQDAILRSGAAVRGSRETDAHRQLRLRQFGQARSFGDPRIAAPHGPPRLLRGGTTAREQWRFGGQEAADPDWRMPGAMVRMGSPVAYVDNDRRRLRPPGAAQADWESHGAKAAPPVRLKPGESLSYVERPLRGDAWEYDPRFARWGRPFVLNANPPPTQRGFVQRLIGRLGELHDVAQWKQGRGPRPANLPPPRPLYPYGSYGHARRGTKAYDRGGYRPHGRSLEGAQRKELVSPLFLRRFGADASADTRLPVTTPGQSGPVVRRLPGRPTRWSDWEAGDLARMEARDELSRVPVQRVLQRAKMLEKSGRLQEVLARLAAALRSTKAHGMTGSERTRGAYQGRPAPVVSRGVLDPALGVASFQYPGRPPRDAGTLRQFHWLTNRRLLQLREQAARQQGRPVQPGMLEYFVGANPR